MYVQETTPSPQDTVVAAVETKAAEEEEAAAATTTRTRSLFLPLFKKAAEEEAAAKAAVHTAKQEEATVTRAERESVPAPDKVLRKLRKKLNQVLLLKTKQVGLHTPHVCLVFFLSACTHTWTVCVLAYSLLAYRSLVMLSIRHSLQRLSRSRK